MTYKLYGNNPRLCGTNFYRWSQYLHCNHPKRKQNYVGFTVYSDVSWCILTYSPFFPHLYWDSRWNQNGAPSPSLCEVWSVATRYDENVIVSIRQWTLSIDAGPSDMKCDMHTTTAQCHEIVSKTGLVHGGAICNPICHDLHFLCLFIPHKQSSKHDRPGVTAQIRKEASTYDNHSGSHGSMISADWLLIPSTFKPTKQTANWLTFFTSRGVKWTKDHPAW